MNTAKLTKNLVLGMTLLLFIFSVFMTPNIGISENPNLNTEKTKFSLDASYIAHAPIDISSNSQFSGFPGDGSEEDPYRIENLYISFCIGCYLQHRVCQET